jgi:hypothetical protein
MEKITQTLHKIIQETPNVHREDLIDDRAELLMETKLTLKMLIVETIMKKGISKEGKKAATEVLKKVKELDKEVNLTTEPLKGSVICQLATALTL